MGRRKKLKKAYATTKQVLKFAGVGAFIAGSLIMPGLPRILRYTKIDWERFFLEDTWEEFDETRLRQKLKNLAHQKLVKIYEDGDKIAVKITKRGKQKLLKYKLEDLQITKPDSWDKKWRIVAYDIPKDKNTARNAIQTTLKRLGFLQLQKSVYLYPYSCTEIIEFLREFYNIGEYVTYLTIGYLENEDVFKEYFDLD